MSIIRSMLDTDFYKFSIGNLVFQEFSGTMVEYTFKCRNEKIVFTKKIIDRIHEEIKSLNYLGFTFNDIEYLDQQKIFKPNYLRYLSTFRFNTDTEIIIYNEPFGLKVIGPWERVVYYETILLPIINECYFEQFDKEERLMYARKILNEGIYDLQKSKLPLIDFGTRRRFSFEWHREVLQTLKNIKDINLLGTSNVFFAKLFNLPVIGTQAHEVFMAAQRFVPVENSQIHTFQVWQDEYRGKLGIALSDTLGSDKFFKDFDGYFARLYDGCRQDSGDPFVWCKRLIKHYEKLGINPKTKKAIFSDGLTIKKAIEIYKEFGEFIQCSFGIGTKLTNYTDVETIDIVIKLSRVNGAPVAKLSDSVGKIMCEDEYYLNYLQNAIKF